MDLTAQRVNVYVNDLVPRCHGTTRRCSLTEFNLLTGMIGLTQRGRMRTTVGPLGWGLSTGLTILHAFIVLLKLRQMQISQGLQ